MTTIADIDGLNKRIADLETIVQQQALIIGDQNAAYDHDTRLWLRGAREANEKIANLTQSLSESEAARILAQEQAERALLQERAWRERALFQRRLRLTLRASRGARQDGGK